MDNDVTLFEIVILNFEEIANYYKLLTEKELRDIQAKLIYKTPSDGLLLIYNEIQKTSEYLETGFIHFLYTIFNQPYTIAESQAKSFESLTGSFPLIPDDGISGFPYLVKFMNSILSGTEISDEDYDGYLNELKSFPEAEILTSCIQSGKIEPFFHFLIHIKYRDFYRMQLKNLYLKKQKADAKSNSKPGGTTPVPESKFSLKNIFINEKKLEYVLKELVYREYIAPETNKWIDRRKGKQIRAAALIEVLYQKGYLRKNYAEKEMVEILKINFDVTTSERTCRKFFEIKSEMKEFEFLKPATEVV